MNRTSAIRKPAILIPGLALAAAAGLIAATATSQKAPAVEPMPVSTPTAPAATTTVSNSSLQVDRLDRAQPASEQHITSTYKGSKTNGDPEARRSIVSEEIKLFGADQLVQLRRTAPDGAVWTYWTEPTSQQRKQLQDLADEYNVNITVETGSRHTRSQIDAAISKVAQSKTWGPRLDITAVGRDDRDGIRVGITGGDPGEAVRVELEQFAGVPVTWDTGSSPIVLQ